MTEELRYSEEDVMRIAKQAVRETMSHSMSLPRDEAAEIAKVTALTTVQESNSRLFAMLGYNIANIEDVTRFRDDMGFVGTLRKGSSNIAGAIVKALAVAIVLVFLAWMAVGARDALATHSIGPSKYP